jgi:hypothetical protein
VLDITASLPIDDDPAPAHSGSGLPSEIAVLGTLSPYSDVPAVLPASITFAVPLVPAPVELVAAIVIPPALVDSISEFERGHLAGIASAARIAQAQP